MLILNEMKYQSRQKRPNIMRLSLRRSDKDFVDDADDNQCLKIPF